MMSNPSEARAAGQEGTTLHPDCCLALWMSRRLTEPHPDGGEAVHALVRMSITEARHLMGSRLPLSLLPGSAGQSTACHSSWHRATHQITLPCSPVSAP